MKTIRKSLARRLTALALSAVLAVSGSTAGIAAAGTTAQGNPSANTIYYGDQGDLTSAFLSLPPGAVRAQGWLENQLLLQKNGLTGKMAEFTDYNGESSQWLGAASGENWERGPYYMHGLVALAYVLDDADLKEKAQKWIDSALDSQQENGFFGPRNNDDWWPRMPVLMAICDYYDALDAQGKTDARVLPFLENYFRYQESELQTRPLRDWGSIRGGDNVASVYWLYSRLYQEDNPQATQWLLDLADTLFDQTKSWDGLSWTDECHDTTIRQHVVNISQGLKTPALRYQTSGDEADRTAMRVGLFNLGLDHGRIDGLPNADESSHDNRSTRGSEDCGIVENLLSTEITARILGEEAWLGDHLERVAYNALPAANLADYNGQAYFIMQNQVTATQGSHGFTTEHGDDVTYGAPTGLCCFPNFQMGWPKFVQSMWMATRDNGLAVVAYGPNTVTARVADGKTARFQQETDYPFRDTVELTYSGEAASFELKLRIPAWAVNPAVTVNGEPQAGVSADSYYTVTREWKPGDHVKITFPSEVETSTWYNDSVAVEKGPLIYSLRIDEDFRAKEKEDNEIRDVNSQSKDWAPRYEVFPASRWNYGLVTGAGFETEERGVGMQPFTASNPPVVLKATGQVLPDWTLDGNVAGAQPFGPTKADPEAQEPIELVPYGCTKLRVTQFPKIGDQGDTLVRTRTEGKAIQIDGEDYLEFDNLVVPRAEDYTVRVTGSGSGTAIVNGKYRQSLDLSSGQAELSGLKSKPTLQGGFRFDAQQFNNLRFTGGLSVDQIEVVYSNRAIEDVQTFAVNRKGDRISIATNLDPRETPFKVVYGTEPGVYPNTVRGFDKSTAVLTGMDPETTYYVKVIASIKGQESSSGELVVEKPAEPGELVPNPNVPDVPPYTTFPTSSLAEWKTYDPENKIQLIPAEAETPAQIVFGTGEKVKAVYMGENSENWVDYKVEATLRFESNQANNCGIIFRAASFGDGPDAFYGYYAGIGNLANGSTGLITGFGGETWNNLAQYPIPGGVQAGQDYTLKIVVFGSRIAFYVDGNLIATTEDETYSRGTVGLRSYNKAFTASNFSIYPLTRQDLTVFAEPAALDTPVSNQSGAPDFSDDFEDARLSESRWTKVGETGLIRIENGVLSGANHPNIKAVAGEDSWTNYVYQADVSIGDGPDNAGLLFRTTAEGSGPDAYNGYYFGLYNDKYIIGKASNNWSFLHDGAYETKPNKTYQLKVIAYDDLFGFFIDGKCVYRLKDADHPNGKIGFRCYQKAFTADNVLVRGVTPEDVAAITTYETSVESACNLIQARYPQMSGADNYKILFGTEPGRYTDAVTDIYNNINLSADKTAFTVPEAGTYYVKVQGFQGSSLKFDNREMTITTGARAPVAAQREKLRKALAEAKALDVSGFTQPSRMRLTRALANAEAVLADINANQMDLSAARCLLEVSCAKGDSVNWAGETALDKTPLLDKIREAKAIGNEEGTYTQESYAALQAAIAAAEAALDTAFSNAEIAAEVKKLDDAIQALRETAAPKAHILAVQSGANAVMTVAGNADVVIEGNGIYGATVQAGEKLIFTFTPASGKFAGAKLNGEALPFEADSFTYAFTMPNETASLRFTFTLINKNLLEAILHAADAVTDGQLDQLIPSVRRHFTAMRKQAQEVLENEEATQAQINSAWKSLLEAMQYLEFKAGDKTALNALLETVDNLNEADYTGASWDALTAAADAAEAVVADGDALAYEVTEAYDNLEQAIKGLESAVHLDALHEAVAKAESLNLDEYLDVGQDVFAEALKAAKDLLEAADVDQTEVNKAADNLNNAMLALQRIASKESLERIVAEAKAVNLDEYLDSGSSKEDFTAALEYAEAVLENPQATQRQVQDASDRLTNAMLALRMIPDRDMLEDLLKQFETVDPADYTPASYASYQASINLVRHVLEQANPSQKEMNAVYFGAKASYDNLVKAVPNPKPAPKPGKSTQPAGNPYGTSGYAVVNAAQDVSTPGAYVVSDTTVSFTLRKGSAYCFKMTIPGGANPAPCFTVGNGSVLKTQFVTRIGNAYYYRVWAIGAPGQSTGVYTQISNGAPQKHCAVTIG